jgi:hypothetical protein
MSYKSGLATLIGSMIVWGAQALAAVPPADTLYRNGKIHTVDARNSTQESLAVRDGGLCMSVMMPVPRSLSAQRPGSLTSADA